MPAPAQAPAHKHAGGASDSDGARRREDAARERSAEHEPEVSAREPRRTAVAHAYTSAGRAVQEPLEERPGISVLA